MTESLIGLLCMLVLAFLRLPIALAMGVVGIVGYSMSTGTDNPLQQRDAVVLALIGVSVSVAGMALFLRYSLGALLRLWLARLVLDRDGR